MCHLLAFKSPYSTPRDDVGPSSAVKGAPVAGGLKVVGAATSPTISDHQLASWSEQALLLLSLLVSIGNHIQNLTNHG